MVKLRGSRLFSNELSRWLLLYTYGRDKTSASRAGCARGDKGRGDRIKRAMNRRWPS